MSIVIINFLCRILQCVSELVYYYNTLHMLRIGSKGFRKVKTFTEISVSVPESKPVESLSKIADTPN